MCGSQQWHFAGDTAIPQAWENRALNWKRLMIFRGFCCKYAWQTFDQCDFRGSKTPQSRGWGSWVVCGGRQTIITSCSLASRSSNSDLPLPAWLSIADFFVPLVVTTFGGRGSNGIPVSSTLEGFECRPCSVITSLRRAKYCFIVSLLTASMQTWAVASPQRRESSGCRSRNLLHHPEVILFPFKRPFHLLQTGQCTRRPSLFCHTLRLHVT